MPHQKRPQPMTKEIREDIANHEKVLKCCEKGSQNTLTQFFNEEVEDAWDLSVLSPDELLALQENLANGLHAAAIVITLKNKSENDDNPPQANWCADAIPYVDCHPVISYIRYS
jgi:hypothetical protein